MPDLVALREDSELLRLDLVLPGIVENVRNALEEANGVLLAAKEQENTTSKFAQARKTYDCSIVELASKWFNVLPEAIEKLTPERRKELEELILRKAEEGMNRKRLLPFLYNHSDLGLCCMAVFCIVAMIIGGMVGGIKGLGVGVLGGYTTIIVGLFGVSTRFDKHSVREIHDLLKSHKFLNGDKE